MIKCKFCNAENESRNERCFSCSAPIPKRSNITEKDHKNLSNYINSVENMLKSAKKKADGKVFLIFIVSSIIWLATTFLIYYFFKDDLKVVIIFGVVLGFVLFIGFGGFIGYFENKAMENIFDRKIKNDVREYLKAMHYTETDFKNVASEVIKEKSPLNKFLADI